MTHLLMSCEDSALWFWVRAIQLIRFTSAAYVKQNEEKQTRINPTQPTRASVLRRVKTLAALLSLFEKNKILSLFLILILSMLSFICVEPEHFIMVTSVRLIEKEHFSL